MSSFFWQTKHSTTEAVARQQWHTEINQLPKGRINKDKAESIYPVKRYVDFSSAREKDETLRLGQKQKKTPTAEEYLGTQSRMGRGHERLDDKFWSKALGLGEDGIYCVEAGEFSKPQRGEALEAQFTGEEVAALKQNGWKRRRLQPKRN